MLIDQNNHETIIYYNLKELEEMKERISPAPLSKLKGNQYRIETDSKLYYHFKGDKRYIRRYYKSITSLNINSSELFERLHKLVKRTHRNRVPYFISKDQYLYTWVDLQPNGTIKSIYSGERKDPKQLIEEDYNIIYKRYESFQQLLKRNGKKNSNIEKKMLVITGEHKFNAEHIVPQSWYGAKEPMKGDLHHLFACQPECNAKRSNYPYDDFSNYIPESPDEKIQNRCGVTQFERFEPEYGKGTVARAMLYILLRYPHMIQKSYSKKIDIQLLFHWHERFPATVYELHRNKAIFHIQGNRNPFIDFPQLARKVAFKL
ncbi:endonuclease I family protein [Bacillus aquiflavi]|uniref:endonuclease I family protein n=1 Tax=Bacillus aquiflavi TaxID=2672567 RepID=UPI00223AA1EB|nr:endonuclease [Bacillus aquiflavi]